MRASRHFLLLLIALTLAIPAFGQNVTVTGNVLFSSLDGSALDDDGTANGTFTVTGGDLIVAGTINCNDTGVGSASACAMRFQVTGKVVLDPGSALYAENRTGAGAGGAITINAGGNLVVGAGAIISSESTDSTGSGGGNITLNVGGTSTFAAGSVVSAGSKGGNAGSIALNGGQAVTINGVIASGPGRTLTASKTAGQVLSGGSADQRGGNITINVTSTSDPTVFIGGDAVIVSQGEIPGAGRVQIDACGIEVRGLVASIGRDGGSNAVAIRSGTTLLIDGRDLAGAGSRRGLVRVDATNKDASTYRLRALARTGLQILGPASGGVAVLNSNPGGNNAGGGTIDVVSLDGTVTATGNAARAGETNSGADGGNVNVSAKGAVNLDTAALRAQGGTSGQGGRISVRSHSAGVSWQNGTGDVRPTGTATAAADRGSITITYCTTVSTTGSTFPVNGSVVAPFPATVQSCSPGAPALPAGEQLNVCNRPPVVNNDAYTVAEGGTLNVPAPGVLANDVEPDGQPMAASLVSGPVNGTLTFNADGSFVYVHNGGETTSDSFTYKASDGTLDSTTATVSITVTPVNDAPVANNDAYSVAEGGTINLAVPGVKSNDSDPDNTNASLVVQLVSNVSNGTLTLNPDGSFIYVHNGSETTSDSFTYRLSDGAAFSNVATVAITIDAINDVPVANADSYSVAEGGTLNVAAPGVLGNDTDGENSTLTAVVVSGPSNGSLTLNANGSFTYTHNGGETTSDSFSYRANDGTANSAPTTVTITVTPVNDAPVANNDAYTVAENGTLTIPAPGVLGNDTDAEGQTLVAVVGTGATAGTLTLNPDGSFTYVHNGSEGSSDSFTYTASDGSATSNVATVTITVTPVNDTPVAVNDAYSVTAGSTLTVAAPGVLGNDTDAENQSLSATLVTGPTKGTLTLNANGSFSYVHNGTSTGTDTFTYTATDGSATSNTATVTITIVNQAPNANNDAYVGVGNTELRVGVGPAAYPHALLTGSVLANDTDPEGTALVVTAFSATSLNGGTVTMLPNGTFSYLPAVGFTGADSFSYTASDGVNSDTASVTITVSGRIWYVKNTAALGNGRSPQPFNTLSAAQTASAAGDTIFVHTGAGNSGPGGIVLKPSQSLIGEGVALVSGPYTLWPAGSRPTIGGISLSSSNVVRGLNVSALGAGISGGAGSSATVELVGISGGTDGISLSSATGAFSFTDVTVNPGGIGLLVNGGTPSVTLSNVDVVTTNFRGIQIDGGTLAASNGSSVSTANRSAVVISGTALTAAFERVTSTNATVGIDLSNNSGSFSVTGSGAAGSGGTISGATSRGVQLSNTGAVSLRYMNLTTSTQQAVLYNLGAGNGTLEVRNSTVSNNGALALQFSNSGPGNGTVVVDGNTGSNNPLFVLAQTTAGQLTATITNNVLTFSTTGSPINVTRNASATGNVTTTITGNTIGTLGVANSGCVGGCAGVNLNARGSNGTFKATVTGNTIQRVDAVGVNVGIGEGNISTSLTISNNVFRDATSGAYSAIFVDNGVLGADTSSVCASMTSNSIDASFDPSTAIYVSTNYIGTTFRLPGYLGTAFDTNAIQTFISNNNGGAGVFANASGPFSGGAACP